MIKDSQKLILQTLTFLLFLNLTIYLPAAGFFPFPAYFLDILILLFLLSYYLKKKIALPFGNMFVIWLLYFLCMNIIYYIFSENGAEEFALFKVIVFLILVYSYMIFLFALDNENLSITRTTLVFIAPIATLTLGIDYFQPGYFLFDATDMTIQGRAASVYRNANYAGSSMIVLLILGIDMIPKKYRLLFLLIIFLGIFFTMSRSNLMTFFIIVFIMFFQKKISLQHTILSVLSIVVFFTWLATGGLDTLSEKYDIEITDNMKSRIAFFTDTKSADISDMNERQEVLKSALNLFKDNPIFGAGFGATTLWEHRVGSHNTFTMLWAEQGLFGFLLIPLLFFCSTYYIFKYGGKEQRQLAFLFIVSYTLSCFFSHDRLSETTVIAFMIILSTISYKLKQKHLENN